MRNSAWSPRASISNEASASTTTSPTLSWFSATRRVEAAPSRNTSGLTAPGRGVPRHLRPPAVACRIPGTQVDRVLRIVAQAGDRERGCSPVAAGNRGIAEPVVGWRCRVVLVLPAGNGVVTRVGPAQRDTPVAGGDLHSHSARSAPQAHGHGGRGRTDTTLRVHGANPVETVVVYASEIVDTPLSVSPQDRLATVRGASQRRPLAPRGSGAARAEFPGLDAVLEVVRAGMPPTQPEIPVPLAVDTQSRRRRGRCRSQGIHRQYGRPGAVAFIVARPHPDCVAGAGGEAGNRRDAGSAGVAPVQERPAGAATILDVVAVDLGAGGFRCAPIPA